MFIRLSGVGQARAALIGLVFLAACRKPSVDACSDGRTCFHQARALLDAYPIGKGPAEGAAQIVDLLQRACDLGSGPACELLAGQLEVGNLGPIDLPRAVRLYDRGCTLQEVRSCNEMSNFYRDGRGVPKDATLAQKYRQLTCGLADSMTRDTFCEWNKHDPLDGAAPK
jgi:TPR repeat protein